VETVSPQPTSDPGSAENPVLAAGVLLWSGAADSPRFLLLQNARHQTWSFAKGHLEAGEDLLEGACREVAEETGVVLQQADLLAQFADSHLYQVQPRKPSGRGLVWKRVVMFLAAHAIAEEEFVLSDEHQDFAWLPAEEAVAKLEHDALRRSVWRAHDRLRRSAPA
jgi:8-oxo-dGTP pyrophosphatase MutT (NUDIX family)